jgi:hypothetical protein
VVFTRICCKQVKVGYNGLNVCPFLVLHVFLRYPRYLEGPLHFTFVVLFLKIKQKTIQKENPIVKLKH